MRRQVVSGSAAGLLLAGCGNGTENNTQPTLATNQSTNTTPAESEEDTASVAEYVS